MNNNNKSIDEDCEYGLKYLEAMDRVKMAKKQRVARIVAGIMALRKKRLDKRQEI